MWYVYVLQSLKDDGWYIGCSNDLRRRFKEHNLGKSESTRYRGPYKIIYYESGLDKTDAFKREIYLKSGYGRRWLKKRLENWITTKGR